MEVTKVGGFSPWHWAILAVVVVLLFGAKRLPDAARSLGKSMRIFKAEVKELNNDQAGASAPSPTQVASERVVVDPVQAPAADPDVRPA